ncbi:hypothetical protein GE061_005416, partial [Apolygus lucorum]
MQLAVHDLFGERLIGVRSDLVAAICCLILKIGCKLQRACIDDNLDLVEFLVEHGADVNKGDNEGWTPLHATASCGFISIAKYLIENGANVAAVNNDGELPVDVAESDEMEDMLQKQIDDI